MSCHHGLGEPLTEVMEQDLASIRDAIQKHAQSEDADPFTVHGETLRDGESQVMLGSERRQPFSNLVFGPVSGIYK